jgi:arsenate reductase
MMKTVLFVCVHNSGRSQMAEAFFNKMAEGRAVAVSAGTQPAAQVNPTVVAVMHEMDIEIGTEKPKLLTPEILESADRVVTMDCSIEEVCPASFVPAEDWKLEDPEGQPVEKVRKIRDEIKARVEVLIQAMDFGWLS